jgi:hypothetical protein
MTTSLNRIRIRLAEAEACRAMLVYPHQGIDARVSTWRDAEAECIAGLPREAAQEPAFAASPIVALPPLQLRPDFVRFVRKPDGSEAAAAWNNYVPPGDRSDAEGGDAEIYTGAAVEPAPQTPAARDAADNAPASPTMAPQTTDVIALHQAAQDKAEEAEPAEPQQRTSAAARTPERMERFVSMWKNPAFTRMQIEAVLAAMPGPPMPRRKGILYEWAALEGLPTRRLEAFIPPAPQADASAAPDEQPARHGPLATCRTPERMRLFKTLWMNPYLTARQVLDRVNELPGDPVSAPPALYGWARIAGLPTKRPVPPEEQPPPPVAPAIMAPPLPPPPAAPEEPAPGPVTHAQREAIRRLRGQAYNVEAIARRTGVPLDVVQALDAQAEAAALDLLAIPSDTDTIFLETGLTPTRIKALRDRAKKRAA